MPPAPVESVAPASDEGASSLTEALHKSALAAAALSLIAGLAARNAAWVNVGVSLMLLLPPLRLATTIIEEAHDHRYGIAAMGVLVLAFLLLSRRIS